MTSLRKLRVKNGFTTYLLTFLLLVIIVTWLTLRSFVVTRNLSKNTHFCFGIIKTPVSATKKNLESLCKTNIFVIKFIHLLCPDLPLVVFHYSWVLLIHLILKFSIFTTKKIGYFIYNYLDFQIIDWKAPVPILYWGKLWSLNVG